MIEVSTEASKRIKEYVEKNADDLAIRVFLATGG